MKIVLIFPNQLFQDNACLEKINKQTDVVFLVEDYLFFRQFSFHKQKLILHRASMKSYEQDLKALGYKVKYIESKDLVDRKSLGKILVKEKVTSIVHYEVVDNWLEQDLKEISDVHKIDIESLPTPMFLNSHSENMNFFASKKKPFMKTFYEWQRKRLNILMDKDKMPAGGKYSFDTENRKKLPKDYVEPENISIESEKEWVTFVTEAKEYVEKNFKNNYGNGKNFEYAINTEEARKILKNFLHQKLGDFGTYEDAISSELNTINHSLLTPYLNTGLITPAEVVKETLKYAKENSKNIGINNLEGFLRQIIGWREFMRAMYEIHGTKMRNSNFFKHTKKLPQEYWTGKTGYLPVDNTIKKALGNSYNHHIERLMIMGNFMLLNEYDPNYIYKWFMEMYIDSYDWVMVPNVYGMSQFADGGIFATKPYISGSNYILKMSNYKKEASDNGWDKKWDELFWTFLKKHKLFFSKNPRFAMLLKLKNF